MAEKEVEVQTETEIPSSKENEVVEQRDTEAPPEMEKETEKQPEPEGQCSTATLPAPNIPIQRKFTPQTYPAFTEGWAGFSRGLRSLQASHWTIQGNLEKMRESVQGPTIPQARRDLLALNALHFMEQVLQEENARLKADGSTELAAERSKVKSLHEQIATYQRGTQDLEAQFDSLQAQISILESRASASEGKVGSLEAELVEKESWISELENSLREAKHEGSRLNELALKEMEARRLTLEKLKEERQTASELRSKKDELEKAIAAHQEEVAGLTARAAALYEEGKFDMQHCIYEAVWSGLPAHRSLDDFISHYGLPFPLPPTDSRVDPRVVFIDLTISDSSFDSSSLALPSLGAPTPELSSGPSLASEQSVTSPLPREENHPHLPPQVSGGAPPSPGVLLNGARMEASSGRPGTSRPQKRRNPHSGTSRLVSGWLAAIPSLSDFFSMESKSRRKVVIGLTPFGTSSSSDDDFSASPAQSSDMAGLSPGEFSRLYPTTRLPAPSPPSPPRLPPGRIDWGSTTIQDFALYQWMRRARLGRSSPIVEVEPSCESRTASPNLLKSPNDGSSLRAAAPRPGTWEDYDIWEAADSTACPSSKRRSPWKGPPPPSC
ncbi:unnamed protein product [Cuscuta campestris]|uniref:Uncharacterized protein n=1 Tax=Cuscuta campestris TaxID=132261 RepID=A0A484N8J0_9ASTE|nr:unnamed protein product [Cuscuta campestris]